MAGYDLSRRYDHRGGKIKGRDIPPIDDAGVGENIGLRYILLKR